MERTGFILYVVKFEECVAFYTNILALEILFEAKDLVCFKFGYSYLMVERDDSAFKPGEEHRIRTCLRMNVKNVKKYADWLTNKGVEVDYQENSWGIVAKFFDPDGNLCAFKDSEKFEWQIEAHK